MRILILTILLSPMIAIGQSTYIPDDDFEQSLINLGYDTVLDDSVLTTAIDTVTFLHLGFFINNIYDLTGIEDFSALKDLTIWQQFLTTLDLSQNIFLESLNCTGNNLTNLNLSNNSALTSLNCSDNQLVSLDLRNNNNIVAITTINNLDLSCINVDNVTFSNNNWTNNIEPEHYFSVDCNSTTGLDDTYSEKKLIKTSNIIGKEITPKDGEIIFYIYDNKKVEKIINYLSII